MSVGAVAHRRASYETNPKTYRLLKRIISAFMRLVYRYEITGQDHVPGEGPLIIAVNHLHLLDPLATAPAVPRQITTLAASKWRNTLLIGWFLRKAGSIFVRRGEADIRALRECLEALHKGHALAIAPEGTRSRSGMLQRGKTGIAYLALRTETAILPVAIQGVERLREWARLRRPTCRVIIGEPFRLPKIEGKATAEELQTLSDLVMLRIALALPETYRGVYAQRAAAIEAGHSDELSRLRPI